MLIAEIGNAHFGDFDKAKLLIKTAHAAGADLIKAQAFHSNELFGGSMPGRFYDQCEFSLEQYLELIHYARDLGNDLFYSIFTTDRTFDAIRSLQKWQKLAGSQSMAGMGKLEDDAENLIVSVPVAAACPLFKKAEVLHVSEYMTTTPNLWHIELLSQHIGRQAGYSDHTIGIETCIRARKDFGAILIEKHFCLEKNMDFHGTVYRDSVHGASPWEFNKLATELQK